MSEIYSILVICPDSEDLSMIESVLKGEGHEVEAFHQVSDEVNQLEKGFQFFILDQSVSQDDIAPLMTRSRNQGRIALVRIGESSAAETGPSRVRAYLKKPLDPIVLTEELAAVGAWLKEFQELPPTPRILIVDDNEYVLESSLAILEDHYSVTGTLSANEGIELLMNKPFEILLVDLMMEEIHGMDMIHLVKKEIPNLIAIVMTGYSSKEVAIRAVREGANDYLEKPLTPEAVRGSVTNAWDSVKPRLERNVMLRRVLNTNQQILNEKGIPGSTGGEGDFSREEKESELLDQLLSTMEVDEDELDVEAVDFSALLEEVRSDIFAAAGGKAPEWSVGSIPNIQSDSFFLKKSLFFLLNECTESCNRKGSGTIQIQSKASEGSGFLLEIQDNGYREPGSTTNTYKLLVGEKPWLDPGDHGYPWIETREELDKIGIHVKSYKCSAEGLNLELAVPMECPVI